MPSVHAKYVWCEPTRGQVFDGPEDAKRDAEAWYGRLAQHIARVFKPEAHETTR